MSKLKLKTPAPLKKQSLFSSLSPEDATAHTKFMMKASSYDQFDDDSVSLGSTVNIFGEDSFEDLDFELPPEEFTVGCELEQYRMLARKNRLAKIAKMEERSTKEALTSLDKFSNLPLASFGKKGKVLRSPQLKFQKTKLETNLELETIKHLIGKQNRELIADDEECSTCSNEYSTLDHPKLGSMEEKLEDLRQDATEKWCLKHGREATAKFHSKDKRLLRKWFQELDYDGSGEVNVNELQDPMLSSGILKTREQVVRVLCNVDKNKTMGIDFEEFLQALHGNKLADTRKLKRLQDMGSNPLGFSMETLITEERRKKLINSVMTQFVVRQQQYEKVLDKVNNGRGNRREREKVDADMNRMEELHRNSRYLHDRYVEALDVVIAEKIERLRVADNESGSPGAGAESQCDEDSALSKLAVMSSHALRTLTADTPVREALAPISGTSSPLTAAVSVGDTAVPVAPPGPGAGSCVKMSSFRSTGGAACSTAGAACDKSSSSALPSSRSLLSHSGSSFQSPHSCLLTTRAIESLGSSTRTLGIGDSESGTLLLRPHLSGSSSSLLSSTSSTAAASDPNPYSKYAPLPPNFVPHTTPVRVFTSTNITVGGPGAKKMLGRQQSCQQLTPIHSGPAMAKLNKGVSMSSMK